MLEDCPFCGSSRVSFRIKDGRGHIGCGTCGAGGPVTTGLIEPTNVKNPTQPSHLVSEARQLWNQRITEPIR